MKAMQAKDINDAAFIKAVETAAGLRGFDIATRWDVAMVLGGHEDAVGKATLDVPEFPDKVILAKARKLIRRGLITGCICGCRGYFELTLEGRALLPGVVVMWSQGEPDQDGGKSE